MAKILILGDLHGHLTFLQDIVRNANTYYKIDYAIQVGDFGFYSNMFDSLKRFSPFAVPVYAIDGNHENHDWLFNQKKVWNLWEKNNNLIFCPRGKTIEIDNRLIAFIGGAMNVDRRQTGSINKKTTNYLLDTDATNIAETLNNMKQVDLMVTHSCPHSIGVGMWGNPIFDYGVFEFITNALGASVGDRNDVGEEVLKKLWKLLDKKPVNWVFGHFHTHHYSKVEDTNFWCVGCADHSDNQPYCIPYIYDTTTNMVEKIISERI